MKSALKLVILVCLCSALLFAFGDGNGAPPNPPPVSSGTWAWISGSSTQGQAGIYGQKGTAASSNVPGARYGAVSWLDPSGKLWLFGGGDYHVYLNELWKYDPTTLEWTWVSGNYVANQAGIYGKKGTATPSNIPAPRQKAISWIDPQGKLWLFGGLGYGKVETDNQLTDNLLNDLWKYDPTTFEWTWVSGSNIANRVGIYGKKGTAASSNVPGARYGAVSWLDPSGKLWLFGGYGYDSAGSSEWLNDLWEYDPTTFEWTWVSGSNAANQAGVYGKKGIAAPSNVPAARQNAISWIDPQGKLWLFGGEGYAVGDVPSSLLNDLWKYDPKTLEWTWVSGSDMINQEGIYGTKGTAASLNVPGARYGAVSWLDPSGKLWLFGGLGHDSAGFSVLLNDLWEYDPKTLKWAWISGSSTQDQAGIYGQKGTAASSNVPGARYGAVSWLDPSGKLWLFGGDGTGSDGKGSLNDLWLYTH